MTRPLDLFALGLRPSRRVHPLLYLDIECDSISKLHCPHASAWLCLLLVGWVGEALASQWGGRGEPLGLWKSREMMTDELDVVKKESGDGHE